MNIVRRPTQPQPIVSGRLVLLILGFVAVCWAAVAAKDADWWIVKWTMRQRFPKVQWISTAKLADWLARENVVQPILLDVRSEEEWKVSRLPGARRVEPGSNPSDVLRDVPPNTPIVTYCSVGYRSGAFATELQKLGFTNVRNLEGSIFAWANEGRLMERDGRPVSVVHPYGGFWAKLVKPELRAVVPD
jgi:rhodanese-related sulfurtransferase